MRNKNQFNKIKNAKGFTGLPNKILGMNLTSAQFHVFYYYVSCTEEFDPSVRITAKTLNLSPSTVVNINKQLEEAGMIVKVEQGSVVISSKAAGVAQRAEGGRVTKYALCHPNKWKPLQQKKRVRLY